jgi:D-alanyl-D-alanine carboxypeptidase (penicillin-binding protein 5/6)
MERWIITALIAVLGFVFIPGIEGAEKHDAYKAFIVTEASTGNILEGENTHLKRPPASITKLMVVYIAMEKLKRGELKLSDNVIVSGKASKMGGTQVYLKEGEVFTLEEMLKATLIASANDAAYAIAEFISGSVEEFVDFMNQNAKALNMTDTTYNFVHGLPPSKGKQEDISSCHDLSILARQLLKHPKILEWTATQRESFRDGKFIMYNSNKLLAKMPSVDGLKTGYYREAGYSVVATAKRGDLRLIVVVLGSPRARIRNNLAVEKFKKYFAQYTMVKVIKKGQVIDKEIFLPQGETTKLKGVASSEFLYPVAKERKKELKTAINMPDKIDGEIKVGQKLGELNISFENNIIGKVDIVSPVAVPRAGIYTRSLRFFGLGN